MVLVSHTSLSASVTLPCLAPAGTAYPPVPHMPTCDSPLDVLVKRGQLTRPSFEVPRTFGVSHLPGSLSMSERPRGPDDKLHHVRMRPAPLDPPPPFPLRMSTVPLARASWPTNGVRCSRYAGRNPTVIVEQPAPPCRAEKGSNLAVSGNHLVAAQAAVLRMPPGAVVNRPARYNR